MEHIRTYMVNLPTHVRGLTSIDEDGEPMIYLNARLSIDQNRDTYDHETRHILRDDFHNGLSIEEAEELISHSAPPSDPFAVFYQRGKEFYGLERDDPLWDNLFSVWYFRYHKDRYEGVFDKYTNPTKRKASIMIKKIFGD